MPLSGTDEFIHFLLGQEFLPTDKQVKVLKGKDITEDFFIKNNFRKPILINKKNGLRLVVPDQSLSIRNICEYLGRDYLLDVIDVLKQDQFKMKFLDFLNYFSESEPRTRRLNVLSLEISKTEMAHLIEPPFVIKEMSLVEKLWREESNSLLDNKPSVQKYCLMSMKNSWTDFHIDFGGSSVWYHVLWGRKVFYLIPPRKRYMKEYVSWMSCASNRMVYFPDLIKKFSDIDIPEVYKLDIKTGNTILLPAGWIHAVHTLEDSMVFGGNFLHSLSIPIQLKIYKIEKFLNTETRFMFPYFEKLHWFVAEYVLQKLEGNLVHKVEPVKSILKGALKLIDVLPEWRSRFVTCSKEDREHNFPGRGDLLMSKSELISRLTKVVRDLIEAHISRNVEGEQKPNESSVNHNNNSNNNNSSRSQEFQIPSTISHTISQKKNQSLKRKSNDNLVPIPIESSSSSSSSLSSSSKKQPKLQKNQAAAPRYRLDDQLFPPN